jgi:hypothetical protein
MACVEDVTKEVSALGLEETKGPEQIDSRHARELLESEGLSFVVKYQVPVDGSEYVFRGVGEGWSAWVKIAKFGKDGSPVSEIGVIPRRRRGVYELRLFTATCSVVVYCGSATSEGVHTRLSSHSTKEQGEKLKGLFGSGLSGWELQARWCLVDDAVPAGPSMALALAAEAALLATYSYCSNVSSNGATRPYAVACLLPDKERVEVYEAMALASLTGKAVDLKIAVRAFSFSSARACCVAVVILLPGYALLACGLLCRTMYLIQ